MTMQSETLTQVSLIAQLRWRLFRNSLRTARAKAELIGQILLSILGGLVALGGGLALYAISILLVSANRPLILHGLLWGVFLAWLFLPLVVAASTATVDFRELLRFPLRFSSFLVLSLAYALFDPVALVALFWTTCIFAGIASARPDVALWIAPVFIGLAAVSLFVSRALMTAIERMLRRRRGRELFFTILVLGMLSVQVVAVVAEDYLELVWKYVEAHPGLLLAFPPTMAYTAIETALGGTGSFALVAAAVLGLYAVLLFLAHRRRVLAQYRGEDLTPESAAGGQFAARVESGWHLPALPGTVTALVEKELRYAARNGFTLMNLLIPLFIPAVIGAAAASGEKMPVPIAHDPGLAFFGCVAYTLMVTMQLVSNQFAFEGHGIQFLFLAPVRFRDVVAAKNLAYATIVILDVVLIWGVLVLFGLMPSLSGTLAALAALPFLLLAQITVGNLLSLYFPRRFDFGKFKQRQSGMSVLLGLLQQVVTLGIASGIYALARWLGMLWAAVIAFLVLGAAMGHIYRLTLGHLDSLAASRRETLTAELCHD